MGLGDQRVVRTFVRYQERKTWLLVKSTDCTSITLCSWSSFLESGKSFGTNWLQKTRLKYDKLTMLRLARWYGKSCFLLSVALCISFVYCLVVRTFVRYLSDSRTCPVCCSISDNSIAQLIDKPHLPGFSKR